MLLNLEPYAAPLAILTLLIALDIFTGFCGAAANNAISSAVMRRGLFHKLAYYCVFILAVGLEIAMTFYHIPIDIPAVGAVVGYIVLTEIVSICENVGEMNPELKDSALLKLFTHESNE